MAKEEFEDREREILTLIDESLDFEKELLISQQKSLQDRISHLLKLMIGIVLLAFVIAVSLGAGLSRMFIQPLKKLEFAASELAKGKHETRVNIDSEITI